MPLRPYEIVSMSKMKVCFNYCTLCSKLKWLSNKNNLMKTYKVRLLSTKAWLFHWHMFWIERWLPIDIKTQITVEEVFFFSVNSCLDSRESN